METIAQLWQNFAALDIRFWILEGLATGVLIYASVRNPVTTSLRSKTQANRQAKDDSPKMSDLSLPDGEVSVESWRRWKKS